MTVSRSPLLFALVVGLAGTPTGASLCRAEAKQPATATIDLGLANVVRQELTTVFRAQGADGALELDVFTATHPILATLSRAALETKPNPAFNSLAAQATARYYTHLIGANDRNGNLLIETATRAENGDPILVEEVGRNALLALDLEAIARLHLSLRRPLGALHWYDGSRAMARAIVANLYDRQSDFFFPINVQSREQLRSYDATSALPLLFQSDVGSNLARRIITNYYMVDPSTGPDVPLASATADNLDDALLDTVALVAALRAAGFHDDAENVRSRAATMLRELGSSPGTRGYRRYLVSTLAESKDIFGDATLALDILLALAQERGRMDDDDSSALAKSVRQVRWALTADATRPLSADTLSTITTSVRAVYGAVSDARERVRGGAYFDQRDSYDYPGVDPGQALERLFDDVVASLQAVENIVFAQQHAAAGLYATASLPLATAVAGGSGEVVWTVGALKDPVEVRSMVSVVDGRAEKLSNGLTLDNTGGPLSFSGRFPVSPLGNGQLVTMTFSLMIDAGGRRSQVHARHSVFAEPPLDVVVNFPRGRTLDDTSVPLVVNVKKKTRAPMSLEGDWFSPVGLRLVEGKQFTYAMDALEQEAAITLHVDVPSPCRPGSFPFKLKFHSNGLDLGTVSSSFFKRFQWLAIGPFPAANDALATAYTPESRIDLMASHNGAGRRISWLVVSDGDIFPDGAVTLRNSLRTAGVAYLYTVVESVDALTTAATLSANAPAALFVNGERVADNRRTGAEPVHARVQMRGGRNHILIKVAGDASAAVYFNLGDDNSVASDAFNNDLADILDGYGELLARSGGGSTVEAQQLVTLRFVDTGAQSVSVIGSFNGWSPEQHRMRRIESGAWEITLSLAPGRYTYRFLIDEREQILDPNSKTAEADGYGGKNSVIVVGQ